MQQWQRRGRAQMIALGLAVAIISGAGPSSFAGALTSASSGGDYMIATDDEQAMWSFVAGGRMRPELDGASLFRFGQAVKKCLDAMTTVEKKGDTTEELTVASFKKTGLAQLTALCGTALETWTDPGH